MSDLNHFIRTYPQALSPAFCAEVLRFFERNTEKQSRNGATVRSGLAESSWVEMDLSQCGEFNFGHIVLSCLRHYKSVYEKDCGIRPALPEPTSLAPLIVKRYEAGSSDQFQPHFDSVGEVADRYLVFLWYLNDVSAGGETDFIDLGLKSVPEMGKLLIFPPYWMYRHAGRPPVSNAKYILSTYLLW